MSKVVSIVNMKGGVGKTTVAVSLAEASAYMSKKTLLVDLDLQINASIALTGSCHRDFLPWHQHRTIEDYLQSCWDGRRLEPDAFFQAFGRVYLLSGSPSISLFERRFLTACETVYKARIILAEWVTNILRKAKNNFDLIICDTPPGLSLISEAAIRMSDCLVVPQIPDRLSTQGIQLYAKYLRDDLELHDIAHRTHVFINGYSAYKKISRDYAEEIRRNARRPIFPYRCFRNAYSETVLYKAAMDRSMLSNFEALEFRDLWGNVSNEVIAATMELWELLGWLEEDDQKPETFNEPRDGISAIDDIRETQSELQFGD